MRKAEGSREIRKREPVLDGLTALVMALCVICSVTPFLYVFAMSFSSSAAITNGHVFLWPVGFNTEAYSTVFRYPHFFRAYGYTLLFAFGGTLISLFMTSLLAYPLSKTWLRGRKTVMRMVVFSMFFSGGMIPNYLLVSGLHLTGTVWAILIPFAINQFYLIILINFFKSLPDSLIEAAKIDGASEPRILAQIVVPLSKPIMATIALFAAVQYWNSYFSAVMYIRRQALWPVQLVLREIVLANNTAALDAGNNLAEMGNSQIVYTKSLQYAALIVVMVPIMCVYPFLQRYFAKGVMLGAVKG